MGIKYANAYYTDRAYGGPEEGGWWYDCGEPVMTLPFICNETEGLDEEGNVMYSFDEVAREAAREQLHKLIEAANIYWPEIESFREGHWQTDGFAFFIESKPGEHYPQERPYYE